jgi:hypothetical protein
MDTHPMNSLVLWLDRESRSISPPMEPRTDIDELKARIAAGTYSLDADAIATAMFGRADEAMSESSEMLEAGEGDSSAGGVDEL